MSFANFWKFLWIISFNNLSASHIFSFFFPSETLTTWVLGLKVPPPPPHTHTGSQSSVQFSFSLSFIFDTFHHLSSKSGTLHLHLHSLLTLSCEKFISVTVFFNSKIPIWPFLYFFFLFILRVFTSPWIIIITDVFLSIVVKKTKPR